MYNYTYDVSYSHIQGDAGDTAYRKEFLTVNNADMWSDTLIKDNMDAIYQKFKDNQQFQNILIKAKEKYQSIVPFDNMPDDSTPLAFHFLFEFHAFEKFHKCLKDLYNNDEISDDNFTKIINFLS